MKRGPKESSGRFPDLPGALGARRAIMLCATCAESCKQPYPIDKCNLYAQELERGSGKIVQENPPRRDERPGE